MSLLKPGFGLGGIYERALSSEASMSMEQEHEHWMEKALRVAMEAVGWSAPNPSVGCVIVRNGEHLSEGYTQAFGGEHAERQAFNRISNLSQFKNNSITVYVTLEPCTHQGAQPPCMDLLLHPAIGTVVIGMQDPDSRVAGQGIAFLKAQGKAVITGVLENEVKAWHFPFWFEKTQSKPLWVAKWAQNEDGYLADANGESKWITGHKSRAYGHWLRQKYDAIVVGAQTWIRDQPQLTVRDCAAPHRRDPLRLIFDPKGRLLDAAHQARLAQESRPIYIFMDKRICPTDSGLKNVFFRPMAGAGEFKNAVEESDFGFHLQSVFCEGGAALLELLMRHDIFQCVHRFVGKKTFHSVSTKHQVSCFDPGASSQWKLLNSYNFEDDHLQEWVKCF